MYATIRKYKTTNAVQLTKKVNESFIPLIHKAPGFVSYQAIDAGNGFWQSISVFENKAQADASNKLAAEYVKKEKLNDLLPGAPEITEGAVVVNARAVSGASR